MSGRTRVLRAESIFTLLASIGAILIVAAQGRAAPLINTYTGGQSNAFTIYENGTSNISARASVNTSNAQKVVNGQGLFVTNSPGPIVGSPTFKDNNNNSIFPDHGNNGGDAWGSGSDPNQTAWMAFELPRAYTLDSLKLWNFPQGGFTGNGVKTAYIWVSMDVAAPSVTGTTGGASPGASWTMVGSSTFTFLQATGNFEDDTITTINLGAVNARHVLIDVESIFLNTSDGVGIAEVQFFGEVLPEPTGVAVSGAFAIGAMLRRRRSRGA